MPQGEPEKLILCWICFFLKDKSGDLVIVGKHLLKESALEAKKLAGTDVTQN